MITGLVVGKFCPLHKGHELLINTALSKCDKLIILSYTSKYNDEYPVYMREYWLKTLFPTAEVHVLGFERDIPLDDDSELAHRNFCYNYLFKSLHTSVQVVFSSESYGPGFAKYLSGKFGQAVVHCMVDQNRVRIPISATEIRTLSSYLSFSSYLHPIVQQSLKTNIAIFGGESSGKTTLTLALARALGEDAFVLEYGRELYKVRRGRLYYEDMLAIGKFQVNLENTTTVANYRICDTTPLTTVFYSQELFSNVDPKLKELTYRKYDHIIVLGTDSPFIQDGTRKDAAFRQKALDFYNSQLLYRKVIRPTGSVEERVKQILQRL